LVRYRPSARSISCYRSAPRSTTHITTVLSHRDIKPSNILVSRVGVAWDFVKVLDFGLVKLNTAQASEASSRLTNDQDVSGTPGYIAPEIVLGTESDHRVRYLCARLRGVLAAHRQVVFEGPGTIKVMFDHVHTPPVPPSARTELPIAPSSKH